MKQLVIAGYSEGDQPALMVGKQKIVEENPSFCCIEEDKLFTLNELGGKGRVCFYIKREDDWHLIDTKELDGGGMCHLSYSPKHGLLFGACYETGHIFSIEVLEGRFGEVTSFLRLEARKTDQISRAHCTQMDPQEQHLYAVNIHTDTIWCFAVEEGRLVLNESFERLVLPEGHGPRHIIFHPKLPIAYVITEYSNVIFVMSHDVRTGKLEVVQQISTLPECFEGKSYGATCKISADGKYLYGANRGHNSIIVFDILEEGCLVEKQIVACGGDWPRDIALSIDGGKLFVCNQRSDEVAVIQVNRETGELGDVIRKIAFHEPSFIQEIDFN